MRYQIRLRAAVKGIALAAFVFYVAWNAYWLARETLPPSIWQKLTGLPCPTSGFCRSLGAYAAGDWSSGFLYNPLAPVFVLLLILSAASIAFAFVKNNGLRLPHSIGRAWCLALGLAWLCKFLLPPLYW